MSELECPSKTENNQCSIHDDFPDRFPEICYGPEKCFGTNYKKHLVAVQPTDECKFGVVKSKAFKDQSCKNCEHRGSIRCRWVDQEKTRKEAKTKKRARMEKKQEEEEQKWKQITF